MTNRQPQVVHRDRKIEQPRRPEFPTRPATPRRAEAAAHFRLRELSPQTKRTHQRNDEQQDGPTAGVPSLKPAQQVGSKSFCEEKDAGRPHGNRRSRHEEKPSERQAQKAGGEISRQPCSGHEAAADQQPGAFLRKPLFAPRDRSRIEESPRPRVLEQWPPQSAREPIQQGVAHPDAEEHAQKTRRPAQAPGRREQRGPHRRHVFLHEGEQSKGHSLKAGEPFQKPRRQPDGQGRIHRADCFAR